MIRLCRRMVLIISIFSVSFLFGNAEAKAMNLDPASVINTMNKYERGELVDPVWGMFVQNPNLILPRNGPQGVIVIGDSRVSWMSIFTAMNYSYQNYAAISCGGEGFDYMVRLALPEASRFEAEYPNIHWKYVICMGVNDLGRVNEYKTIYSQMLASGKDVYFMSVNPFDPIIKPDGIKLNQQIQLFNLQMLQVVPLNRYIDTHNNVAFITFDGTHNDRETSIRIFDYIQTSTGVPAVTW